MKIKSLLSAWELGKRDVKASDFLFIQNKTINYPNVLSIDGLK